MSCSASSITDFEDILELPQAGQGRPASIPNSTAEDWQKVIADYKAKVEEELGKPFPQDPQGTALGRHRRRVRQLADPRAITYRKINSIPEEWGTAVNGPGDGVRQYGRGLRDRRCLHARPVDRRQGSSTANI